MPWQFFEIFLSSISILNLDILTVVYISVKSILQIFVFCGSNLLLMSFSFCIISSMSESEINWQPDFLADRLVKLKPLQETDFETLYAVASDPLIWEQHPANNRYKREIFEQFFKEGLAGGAAFAVLDAATDKIIGSSRFYDLDEANNCLAIGYTFLAKRYWGGEYNKSLKTLMLDYAFQYVEKVIFHIGKTNIRSQKATARFGAREFRPEIVADKHKNNLFYELRKEDWK